MGEKREEMPVSRYRFPSMGSKNPRHDPASTCSRRAKTDDGRKCGSSWFRSQQSEIIRDCPRRVFCTQASAVCGHVFPMTCSAYYSSNLACSLCTEEIAAADSPPGTLPTFYLWRDERTINAVPLDGKERSRAGFPEMNRPPGHLHTSPAPGSIWCATRTNVRRYATAKLTAIEFERRPEHSHLPAFPVPVKALRPDAATGIGMLCGLRHVPGGPAAQASE